MYNWIHNTHVCLVIIKLWSYSCSKCTCPLNFILYQTIDIGISQTHSREWIRFQEHRKKRRTNARARNDIKLNYWNILQNQIKLDTSNWLNMSLCYLRIINVFGAARWWRDEWCRRRVHVQDMMLETLWITFFMRVHLGNIVVKLIFCSTEHAEWVNEHAQNHSCC